MSSQSRFSDVSESIVAEYVAGKGTAYLRDKYGISIANIHHILKRFGVESRSYSVFRKHHLDETVFDDANSKEPSAYWVGFLMADGNITNRPRKTGRKHHGQESDKSRECLVTITLQARDREHISKFRSFLKTTYTIGTKRRVTKNGKNVSYSSISVRSTKLVESLENYGVVPRKTHIARIIGLEENRHFWRGAVDGDGCLSWHDKARKTPALSLVGSFFLIQQFRTYLLGVIPKFRGSIKKTRSSYCVSVTGANAVLLIAHLYTDCETFLDRKMALAREMLFNPCP